MQEQLPLNRMSVSEKLIAINQIWDSLIQTSNDIPTPEWHKDVLSARRKRVEDGVSQFKPLNTVKQELRTKFK
ncbi:MAG: addiction module antitoxin RelB [Gammaproteobacteria bacterium]|nr:MAG: addiction module antitoxin RelB [Gammaproteobacteria bacterium]